MENKKKENKVFKIGIAMAGAVSAGAYTAGVIDYLLEALSKWENKKEDNKALIRKYGGIPKPGEQPEDEKPYDYTIPMHDVVIEVIGGSSAGGMTAAITTLALYEGIRPINDINNPNKEDNRLYDSWVNLNDDQETNNQTLFQMLSTDDIQKKGRVISFLNSEPIDAIANQAKQLRRISQQLPDYISKELEVILTITSLRGIPISVNFFDEEKKKGIEEEPPKPAHRMSLHKGIAHFRINPGTGGPLSPDVLPLDPREEIHVNSLLEAAKATGAFPLGLAPRHITGLPKAYVEAMVRRMFGKKPKNGAYEESPNHLIHIDIEENLFDFYAVDGGTVNNEPFGEVIRVLEEKCRYDEENNYAVLMIDPFPNFNEETESSPEKPPTILDLVPMVIGAIRGQAMIKESDLVDGLSENHTLRMIFPSRRHADGEKDPYPISCGSLDGFGGFFSREFREHDFQLGRKNCQSFLRNYFCISIDRAQEMSVFEGWDAEDPRHKRFYSPPVNGYPIIPDVTYYPEDYQGKKDESPAYQDLPIPTPDKHCISPQNIFDLESRIHHRLKTVFLNLSLSTETDAQQPKPSTKSDEDLQIEKEVNKMMDRRFKSSSLQLFINRVVIKLVKWAWFGFLADKAAGFATRQVIRTILTDFYKRGMLEEDNFKK